MMLPDKELMKQKRGAFDYHSDGKVHVVKWKDNAIVNIASDYMTHSPLRIRLHSIGMGGVDILDRLAADYCLTIRAKKWYWPLFINALKWQPWHLGVFTVLLRKDDSSTWNFIAMLFFVAIT
ncbi:PiggyBac transposable element-derived protein 3 [Trichinella zimbabwensis]|uniref:PiggyBac transposable element-derived protein 3 n=1 Tax=Trichinella zimbabwensis TaxID=268475 RepID=A0A0V1GQS3_9BILA|nr:PiggyBac transposable element-derived protein 3 [Trichinella zimbabwensis]